MDQDKKAKVKKAAGAGLGSLAVVLGIYHYVDGRITQSEAATKDYVNARHEHVIDKLTTIEKTVTKIDKRIDSYLEKHSTKQGE